MRIVYFILTLWHNLSRRKLSTVTTIILLSASMVSLVLTQSLSIYVQNVTNTALINSIVKRTLLVGLETGTQNEPIENSILKIRNMDHVIAAYSSYGRFVSGTDESLKKSGKLDGSIILYGANNAMLPKIVKGQAYTDQDQNVGIIPSKFYPGSSAYELVNYDSAEIIDGESLIGKVLTLKLDESGETYSFKVTGTYDTSVTLDDNNVCYVPFTDIYNITEKYEKSKEDSQEFILVVVDNYKNINNVKLKLNQSGFWVENLSYTNTTLYILIEIFGIVLSSLLLVSCSFIILFSTLRSVKNRTKDIGLMKAVGYTNRMVAFIQISEAIFLGIISFALGIIISAVGIYLLHQSLIDGSAFWAKIPLSIDIKSILISFMLTVVIPILGSIAAIINIIKLPIIKSLAEK